MGLGALSTLVDAAFYHLYTATAALGALVCTRTTWCGASGCRHWLPLLTGQFNYYSCCLVHHQHSMWRGGEVYPSHTLLYRSHVSGVCPKGLLWLVKGRSGEALTRTSSSQ
jgi:hypothetical protein